MLRHLLEATFHNRVGVIAKNREKEIAANPATEQGAAILIYTWLRAFLLLLMGVLRGNATE